MCKHETGTRADCFHARYARIGVRLAFVRSGRGVFAPWPLCVHKQGLKDAPSAWMMQVIDWDKWMDAHVARFGTQGLQMRVDVQELFQKSSPASLHVQRGERSHTYETSSPLLTHLLMGRYTLHDLAVAGAIRLPMNDVMALGSLLPMHGAYFNIGETLF